MIYYFIYWRAPSLAQSCSFYNVVGWPIGIFQLFYIIYLFIFFAAQCTDPFYRKKNQRVFHFVQQKGSAVTTFSAKRKAANTLSFVHLLAAFVDLTTCINAQHPFTLV